MTGVGHVTGYLDKPQQRLRGPFPGPRLGRDSLCPGRRSPACGPEGAPPATPPRGRQGQQEEPGRLPPALSHGPTASAPEGAVWEGLAWPRWPRRDLPRNNRPQSLREIMKTSNKNSKTKGRKPRDGRAGRARPRPEQLTWAGSRAGEQAEAACRPRLGCGGPLLGGSSTAGDRGGHSRGEPAALAGLRAPPLLSQEANGRARSRPRRGQAGQLREPGSRVQAWPPPRVVVLESMQ